MPGPGTRADDYNSEDLVAAVRAGNVQAYEQLFRSYHTYLVDFAARYVKDRPAAEDIVADVFVALWEKRSEWRIRTSVASYMYGATRNRALNAVRSSGHEARRAARWVDSESILNSSSADSPAGSVESAERGEILWSAIETLPEPRRSVVILRWHRQLSFAEIADALEISAPAARKHMERALDTLREVIKGL